MINRTELANVDNEDNEEFGTDSGNHTFDDVFVFSLNEVKIYLPEEASRLGSETTFAIVQYGKFDDNSPSWWLRTPGLDNQNALPVADSGEIFEMGAHVTFAFPIRPAIWVDLSSDAFVR